MSNGMQHQTDGTEKVESDDFSSEPPTVVIPRITTRDLITLDPDGHYARARGVVVAAGTARS